MFACRLPACSSIKAISRTRRKSTGRPPACIPTTSAHGSDSSGPMSAPTTTRALKPRSAQCQSPPTPQPRKTPVSSALSLPSIPREDAEDLLNRAVNLDQASGRQPSANTEIQLADLWAREHNYRKAAEKYQEVLKNDSAQTNVWRAYIATLHSGGQDERASSEAQRMPAVVAGELENDPRFL